MFGYFYEGMTPNRSDKPYTKGSARHFCEEAEGEEIFCVCVCVCIYARLAYRSTYLRRAELYISESGQDDISCPITR